VALAAWWTGGMVNYHQEGWREQLLVPQGVGGGSTVFLMTASHVEWHLWCLFNRPQLKARQELMPTRGIRLFN